MGLMFLTIGRAQALDGFSRACRFDTIPVALQGPAALLFYMLGAPLSTATLDLLPGKERFWIFESITADYGEVKYYLFAEANVFVWSPPAPGWHGDFVRRISYSSSTYKAQRPSDGILKYTKLDIFFANRGVLYSARAGKTDIYDHLSEPLNSYDTKVLGIQKFWYPGGVQGKLLNSTAIDCNLNTWGMGYR
jgi:hypothetical protein